VERKPWQGILVASALPFTADLEVDYDRFAEHVAWLAESGCEGLTPNGSLGSTRPWRPTSAPGWSRPPSPPPLPDST